MGDDNFGVCWGDLPLSTRNEMVEQEIPKMVEQELQRLISESSQPPPQNDPANVEAAFPEPEQTTDVPVPSITTGSTYGAPEFQVAGPCAVHSRYQSTVHGVCSQLAKNQ